MQEQLNLSLTKSLRFADRYAAIYSFNVFNVTNTPSFDIPNDSASIAQGDVGNPAANESAFGQVLSTQGSEQTTFSQLYKLPGVNPDGSTTSNFGAVRNTIGSSRIVEMSLHFTF